MTALLSRLVGSVWFRALVTVLLLGLVLTQIDFSAAWSSLAHAEWKWFVAAVALMAAAIVVGGARWYLLLRATSIDVSRRTAIRAFSLAYFFNTVLPTSVGGDAVRAWIVGRPSGQVVLAATSVVLDKLTALVCLFVFAWAALLVDSSSVPSAVAHSFFWTTLLFFAATAVFAAAAAGSARLVRRLPERLRSAAEPAGRALHTWTRSPRLLLWVFALGIVYQLMGVGVLVLLADAIGFDLSLALAAVSAAIILVAMLVPISIGGFGVREAGFVVLLGEAGISATDATLLSLLSAVVILLASLLILAPLAAGPTLFQTPAARIRESRG
jgi:glycosyltransferase 2 family protein